MTFAAEFRAWAVEQCEGSKRATAEFVAIGRQLSSTAEHHKQLDEAEIKRDQLDEAYWAMIFRAADALDEAERS